jgi:hypothetical protein
MPPICFPRTSKLSCYLVAKSKPFSYFIAASGIIKAAFPKWYSVNTRHVACKILNKQHKNISTDTFRNHKMGILPHNW